MERILEINTLHEVTKAVVEAGREKFERRDLLRYALGVRPHKHFRRSRSQGKLSRQEVVRHTFTANSDITLIYTHKAKPAPYQNGEVAWSFEIDLGKSTTDLVRIHLVLIDVP
jgi:hypothetical protein